MKVYEAALAALLPAGPGECYPSGNPIRFPCGLHRIHGTRGTLILQDGRRFALDDPAQLEAGLAAWLALPRNEPPPEGPANVPANGSAFDAYDAAIWEGRSAERGRQLFASPRYRVIFTKRPQLAARAMGQRIVTTRDGHSDDSDSAQLAVFVSNLITQGRGGESGRLVPGLGAPPEDEIRDLALFWQERLCPNEEPEHYRAHVDYEIARYRPASYAPETTRLLRLANTDAPPLEAPRHRGRPAGQRVEQAEQLGGLLAHNIGQVVRLFDLGRQLTNPVSERMVREYISDLEAAGWQISLKRAGHGLRVEHITPPSQAEINSTGVADEVANPPAEQPTPTGNRADHEAASTSVLMPQTADRATHTEEHTAPLPDPCPVPAVDLVGFVAEAVAAYGHRWRPVKKAAALELGPDIDLRELRKAFDLYPWKAYRAELRALADTVLLKRCKAAARSYQRAVVQSDPRQNWYKTRLEMCEEERRRRGLDLPSGKRQRRGEGFEARKAAATTTAERLRAWAKPSRTAEVERAGGLARSDPSDLFDALDALSVTYPRRDADAVPDLDGLIARARQQQAAYEALVPASPPGRGCVLPQPTTDPSPAVAGLVERLHARLAASSD